MKTRYSGQAVIIAAVIVGVVVALIVGGYMAFHYKRISPGQVGIAIDYAHHNADGSPKVQQLNVGWHWQHARERIVGYKIAQQTLTMVRRTEEGQVKGDDSIQCQDKSGITVNIDVSTLWRVNPDEAAQLYLLKPGVNEVTDIQDQIVRRDTRSAVTQACSGYSYLDIFGDQRADFGKAANEDLSTLLGESHLILDKLVVGEIYLQSQQMDAINAVAQSQQQAIQAGYDKQKAEAEAAGRVAAAEGDKKVAILKAEGDAEQTRIHADAEAKAITIVKDAVGTNYLQYLMLTRWNGQLPQYEGTGSPVIALPGAKG